MNANTTAGTEKKLVDVGRLDIDSSAFFLCDVQERFRPLIQFFPSVIHVSSLMTRAGKLLNVPTIATEQNSRALGKTVTEINLEGVKVFEKMKFSMVIPEVETLLKQQQIKNVVLFGIEAHVCVLQTALDLLERGYGVHILADGTSSTRPYDRLLGLQRAKQAGAWLTSSQSILFQMLETASHSKFKEISALVKEPAPDAGLTNSSL